MIRKTVINVVCISFLIFTSILVKSQTITMKATFDTSSILIGDQVRLRLEFDQPKTAKLQLPLYKDTITGKVQVIKSFPADTVINGANLHIRKYYLVTSFDTGIHIIPPISVPYLSGDVKDTLHSDILQLLVKSLPVDTTKEFRDIKHPLNTPLNFGELWPYMVGLVGIILIIFFVWYVIAGRKKNKIFSKIKISEPPHIHALKELDNLRAEKLWQNGKEKLYYTKLTEIIRVYIEQRYGINALEMTSDEIIVALNINIVEEKKSIELLKNMFSTADLVKFAKVKPLPDENEIGLLNAYQFVNNTKPLITPGTQINESQTESNK